MTRRSRSHKDSFLYKILEDVYNASSLCRPEIDQYHTTNKKVARSVSFSPSKRKLGIHGVSAPTTLKNYRIPIQRPYSANIKNLPIQHSFHEKQISKRKGIKKKSRKRPSTARTPRTRVFHKKSKQIENQCNAHNKRRIRPSSAPIKRSKSALKIRTNSAKMSDKSINHYQSASNLIFRPKQSNKLNIFNLNQFIKHRQCHEASHSFKISHNEPTQNVNESLPQFSRSEWIQSYVKDQKENLFALDEFARMKIMDLDRMNQQKQCHREVVEQNEFDSVIPDVDDENVNTENIEHIHLKNSVNDNSLRMAMYIDLLSMISNESTTKHSPLLKFLIFQITKYTFANEVDTDVNGLSKLCKLSTYFDEATYYKQKYETLKGELEIIKKRENEHEYEQQRLTKLKCIRTLRKEDLSKYFHEWRLFKNVNKFQLHRKKQIKEHCYGKWKGSMNNIKIWNLEARTESLCNELNRTQIYHQIYIGRNKELIEEIKAVKEVLTVICDAVHSNNDCDSCTSAWHNKVDKYLKELKVKHAFIHDLI